MSNLRSPQIARLSPDQEAPGLRLALADFAETDFELQIAMLRSWADRLPGCGYQVWGALHEWKLVGAMLVQTQPGRTAVVWPPRLVADEPQETARRLLTAGLEALPPAGTRMVQALLPIGECADARLLLAAGFQHLSDLLYLVCPCDAFPLDPPCPDLVFDPYSPELHARFARVVEATYEGTLDCPAVNGVRSVDDVLLGYRASGHFDPQRWLLVRHQGEEVGCLLLTAYPEHGIWELIYMGIVPSARGRGFGAQVVRHALWLCGQASQSRLVLAVDKANAPAIRMYSAAHLQEWDQRSVYLLIRDE